MPAFLFVHHRRTFAGARLFVVGMSAGYPTATSTGGESSTLSPVNRPALTTPFVQPSGCGEPYAFTAMTGPKPDLHPYLVSDPHRNSSCQPEGWDVATSILHFSPAVCPAGWTAYELLAYTARDGDSEFRAFCCSEYVCMQ